MKKILTILILITITNTATAKTIEWNTTLNKVLENSYDVQLSKVDVGISKAKILGARSEYYPKLGLYAYNEYSKDLGNDNNGQTMYVGNEIIYGSDIYQNAVSLGLNYNLYDFGIRGDNLKIAKNDNIAKQAVYFKTLRDLEINTVELYAKALMEQKEISVKTEILEIQKELSSIKDRLNKSGQVDKTKAVSANIKLVEIETALEKIRNEHSKTLKDLAYLTKEEYSDDDNINDFEEIHDNFIPVNNLLKASVEETTLLNIEQSPEFRMYDAEIEKKKRELLVAKKQNLPQFTFSTNYYLYGSDRDSYAHSYDNFGQRGLKFRITTYLPIFDGLKNKSERDRIKLEIIRLEIEKEQKIADLKRTFEKIKNDSDYSKKQLENNKKMLALVLSNIDMLDRLNENKLIDKESYLTQKISLLNQKLEVQISQINDFMSAYKMSVINKYESEIGKI